MTNNTTLTPFPTTTDDFQTSFHYYTTPYFPNNTNTISITLQFTLHNASIAHNLSTLDLTETFEYVLDDTLTNNGYPNHQQFLYLHPVSNLQNGSLFHLQWVIFVNHREIHWILYDYLSSSEFIDDFNQEMDAMDTELMDAKISGHSTTTSTTTNTTESAATTNTKNTQKMAQNTLPEHLREFMLIYALLFCVLSISGCCCVCSLCVHHGALSKHEEQKGQDATVRAQSYTANGVPITKWNEINKEEAEFMMKAFDDDETLYANWYRNGDGHSDSDTEIEMMNILPSHGATLGEFSNDQMLTRTQQNTQLKSNHSVIPIW